jgi:hypothetical protein
MEYARTTNNNVISTNAKEKCDMESQLQRRINIFTENDKTRGWWRGRSGRQEGKVAHSEYKQI